MYKAFATGTFNFRDLLRRGGPFESPLGSSLRPLVSVVFLNHNSHFLVGVSYDKENRRGTRGELQAFGIPLNKVGIILRMTLNLMKFK